MMTCAEMAAKLKWAAVRAKNEIDIPTEAYMVVVAKAAKTVIGTYTYGWPQLAQSTQEDRASKGYPANEPLLRTGQMRDSIAHKSALSPLGAEGVVYSSDVVALWQEMGTSRGIPPRSFLFKSMWLNTPEMDKVFNTFAAAILVGSR